MPLTQLFIVLITLSLSIRAVKDRVGHRFRCGTTDKRAFVNASAPNSSASKDDTDAWCVSHFHPPDISPPLSACM